MTNTKRIPNTIDTEKRLDPIFLILIFALLCFGLVMLFSASYAYAYYFRKGNSFFFISRQLIHTVLGLGGMFIISKIHYNFYKRTYLIMLFISMALLVVVLFCPPDEHGFRRWINIKIIQFQPSESIKFSIIPLFAAMIVKHQNKMKTFRYGILRFIIVLLPILFLMRLEPHLSGIVLICSIAGVLMFVGGADVKWFIALFSFAFLLLLFMLIRGGNYMGGRFYYWLHPFSDPLDKTMQTDQSLLAIGSGGIFGLGLGQSRQKFMYLPEVQNDFIFAVICEELGLFGAFLVIILFLLFCYKGFEIASKAPDKFSFLLCTGIIAQFGFQSVYNIAVVTATIPNTGIPLPFFSYGGTALVIQLWEMGIVLNISRYSKTQKLEILKPRVRRNLT